jgi:small subunit ribosomal protein S18
MEQRQQRRGGMGGGPRKKKVCQFCADKNLKINYKDVDTLQKYTTDRGKILPKRVTGTCALHQREVARAIKRARIVALMPYVKD